MRNLQFHIKSNDYFGTLATTLDLLRQSLAERGFTRDDDAVIRRLIKDLLYLQARCRVSGKAKGKDG